MSFGRPNYKAQQHLLPMLLVALEHKELADMVLGIILGCVSNKVVVFSVPASVMKGQGRAPPCQDGTLS